jgi:hypothetical protein
MISDISGEPLRMAASTSNTSHAWYINITNYTKINFSYNYPTINKNCIKQ